jgi:4-amino-4-deoxy-L-arabinose transferase-like glycosyltransferase
VIKSLSCQRFGDILYYMTKTLKLALIFLFLIQVLVAANFELAHDEAYYWLFSKNLDWGYFDHPPMMAVVIRAFSFLPHSELAVRLGFVILQFLTLFFTFKLVSPKKWLWVTLLFFSFPLASFSGILALPDMPLLFFTAVYFWALKRFLLRKDYSSALILGIVIPALLYSKYHGILLIFFTILAVPKILREPRFYLVFLVSLVLFFPHVWWQYEHDFKTFRYHFLERPAASFSFARSLEYLGIQALLSGVIIGPVLWWRVVKEKTQNDFDRVLKFTLIGIVIFFLISSFSKRVEANWTISLVIPFVILYSRDQFFEKRWCQRLLLTSFAAVFLARILLVLPAGSVPLKRLSEFHGWKTWALEVKEKCAGEPMVANTYQMAGKLSFYLDQEITALNIHSRKNQFDFWRWDERVPSGSVCFVTNTQDLPGEKVGLPDQKVLTLVHGASLHKLLNLKNSGEYR